MMEAVCTSKISVYLNDTTRHYIPEGYHLHSRCRENLKSDLSTVVQNMFAKRSIIYYLLCVICGMLITSPLTTKIINIKDNVGVTKLT
jgi:hypothetical protein